jgi:hypothetical protein
LDSAEKTISDKELVSQVRAGDQNAMGALYDRYSPLVYAVGLRVLADTAQPGCGGKRTLREFNVYSRRANGTCCCRDQS